MSIEFREPIDKLGEICVDFDLEPNEVEALSNWLIRQKGNFIKGTIMMETLTKYLLANEYLEIDEEWPDGTEEFREVPQEEVEDVDPLEPEPESETEPEPEPEPEPEDDVLDDDEDDDDGFPPLKPPPKTPRTPQPIRKRRNED